MADYKTIKGVKVQTYSTDPDNPIEGQVWYDNTAQTLQYQVPNKNAAGSWRTGNNMNTGRGQVSGSGTAQTAALAFLGYTDGSYTPSNICESYDGTSWTEIADLNTARYGSGESGSQTSAIVFGGTPVVVSNELWNGSSWTEVGNLNTGRAGAGSSSTTSTSALAFGGEAPDYTAATESWDGSSWTELSDLSAAKANTGGSGTAINAIATGGDPVSANTEEWAFSHAIKTVTTS